MSIFISIASYQDPLLVSTIFSAYNNAQNKDELVFSVCDQSDSGIKLEEIEFSSQIHYEHIDPSYRLTLTLNSPKTGISPSSNN